MLEDALITLDINFQKGFYKRMAFFLLLEPIKPKQTDLRCIIGEELNSFQQ